MTTYSDSLLRDLVKLTMDQNCSVKSALSCICNMSESLNEMKETNKEFVKIMQTLTEVVVKINDITKCDDGSVWTTQLIR